MTGISDVYYTNPRPCLRLNYSQKRQASYLHSREASLAPLRYDSDRKKKKFQSPIPRTVDKTIAPFSRGMKRDVQYFSSEGWNEKTSLDIFKWIRVVRLPCRVINALVRLGGCFRSVRFQLTKIYNLGVEEEGRNWITPAGRAEAVWTQKPLKDYRLCLHIRYILAKSNQRSVN